MSLYKYNILRGGMMSMKILEASELRAEMARYNISRKRLSEDLGLSYSYIKLILSGRRDAKERRVQIYEYIMNKTRNKEIRGIS
jgi:transcriptional regulator with XRE-family HTH domain